MTYIDDGLFEPYHSDSYGTIQAAPCLAHHISKFGPSVLSPLNNILKTALPEVLVHIPNAHTLKVSRNSEYTRSLMYGRPPIRSSYLVYTPCYCENIFVSVTSRFPIPSDRRHQPAARSNFRFKPQPLLLSYPSRYGQSPTNKKHPPMR